MKRKFFACALLLATLHHFASLLLTNLRAGAPLQIVLTGLLLVSALIVAVYGYRRLFQQVAAWLLVPVIDSLLQKLRV